MDKLHNAILTLTGLDIHTNKALKKYAKSGMSGVMKDIYDVLIDVNVDEASRQAMAVLVYNRRMNGSKIPGIPSQYSYSDAGSWWSNKLFFDKDDNSYRLQAFKEVQLETLSKYRVAIYLIDKEKAKHAI